MRQGVKKLLVSGVIVGTFIIYSFIHDRASGAAPIVLVAHTATMTPNTADTPTVSGTTTTGPAPTVTATPSALYKDGSFNGSVTDAQWGYIQVQAVVSGGKIGDVKFLQYPNERQRSVEINSYADPILTSEAIQAQSANVDLVSGATDSSFAFIQSLTDALAKGEGVGPTPMKQTRLLMGMPVTVEVIDPIVAESDLDAAFAYFGYIDETFSTYKDSSEIMQINRGEVSIERCSADMRTILALAERTKRETQGYFDIARNGQYDPSGIVKGWAIRNAAQLLRNRGFHDCYVDAGGDAQIYGLKCGEPWRVGIRNPFNRRENVKILALTDCGIATSGTAIRGQHIYDPHAPETPILELVSLTVIGPDVYEADRFATAAFAMGTRGIQFIEQRASLEGYQINQHGIATYTSGFERFVVQP